MQKKGAWIILIQVIFVFVLYTWATWQYFTSVVPGGNDFIAHLSAWEAYFKHGYSPYSDEAALFTQQVIYGRPALPGEDQNRLTYPFYSILMHAPFVLVGNYALARAIYMTMLQAALFVGVGMTIVTLKWRPPPWVLALVMVWSLFYYPEARGVILGQFAIFGFFFLAASIYFLKRGQNHWAGVLLALTTIKPTLTFLVIPCLIAWALVRRRWSFVAGFFGALILLFVGSFLVMPSWFGEWIFRMTRYTGYTVGQSPVWLLTHTAVPDLGLTGEITISIILLGCVVGAWWFAIRPGGNKWFFWALGVTLVVSNLVVPRSATTNYVMMLIPVIWIFAALDRSSGKWGRTALMVSMLVSFAGLWWLHYSTVVGNQEQPIMFIPSPVLLGLVLLFGYRWLQQDAEKNDLAL